jgi:hypothetical protein
MLKSLRVLILAVTLLAAIFTAQQLVYAWKLYVDSTDSTFGRDRVCANIEGPYGYDRYHCPRR